MGGRTEKWPTSWFNWLLVTMLLLAANVSVATGAACAVTDGSVANGESCTCGGEECTTARGLICFLSGGGACRPNDVGAYGYPRPTSGNCVDVGDRKLIGDKADCEAPPVVWG